MKKNSYKLIFTGQIKRLDAFISSRHEEFSREFSKKLIADGLALVNGEKRKPAYVLKEGDQVEICLPERAEKPFEFEKLVLFEDATLLAVAKPAGLCVHPTDSNWERTPQASLLREETLVSLLFSARPELAALPRLGLVHRLDRDTSGVMLVSKTEPARKALTEQFRDRLVKKLYLGAVSGRPVKDTGIIDAPIGRASGFKKIKVWEYGRDAVTEYTVKEKTKKHALLDISPHTGRTNQIRIHLSYIGHPIIGDKLYGGEAAARMLLHSAKLIFSHPDTGKNKTISAPVPPEFKKAWEEVKAGEKKH
ncbi:MAG: RluA family pseudouridine synthase [Elusimicrobia bacterium]|nr:RluA family pseudouridine synthase [Elusimicrobiota bacterium]